MYNRLQQNLDAFDRAIERLSEIECNNEICKNALKCVLKQYKNYVAKNPDIAIDFNALFNNYLYGDNGNKALKMTLISREEAKTRNQGMSAGFFNIDNNELYLVESGNIPMIEIFAHEFTHFIIHNTGASEYPEWFDEMMTDSIAEKVMEHKFTFGYHKLKNTRNWLEKEIKVIADCDFFNGNAYEYFKDNHIKPENLAMLVNENASINFEPIHFDLMNAKIKLLLNNETITPTMLLNELIFAKMHLPNFDYKTSELKDENIYIQPLLELYQKNGYDNYLSYENQKEILNEIHNLEKLEDLKNKNSNCDNLFSIKHNNETFTFFTKDNDLYYSLKRQNEVLNEIYLVESNINFNKDNIDINDRKSTKKEIKDITIDGDYCLFDKQSQKIITNSNNITILNVADIEKQEYEFLEKSIEKNLTKMIPLPKEKYDISYSINTNDYEIISKNINIIQKNLHSEARITEIQHYNDNNPFRTISDVIKSKKMEQPNLTFNEVSQEALEKYKNKHLKENDKIVLPLEIDLKNNEHIRFGDYSFNQYKNIYEFQINYKSIWKYLSNETQLEILENNKNLSSNTFANNNYKQHNHTQDKLNEK